MNIFKKYKLGFEHIFIGARFLFNQRSLWPYAILPMLINLVLLGSMIGTFSFFYDESYTWLAAQLGSLHIESPNTWILHLANALLWVLDKLFQLLIILLNLILMLLLFYALGFLIAAPFNDLLSEKVEQLVTGNISSLPFWKNIVRTFKAELLKILFFLGIPLFLLLVTTFPFLGPSLYPFITIVFGMFDLGFNYLDYPMARRLLPFRERLRFARSNTLTVVGFGLPFAIPFTNFLLMPILVVGGTLLYLKLSTEPRHDRHSV